jgi:hypothetical protein
MKLLLCIMLSVLVVACSQSQKSISNEIVLADVIATLSPISTTDYVSPEAIFNPMGIIRVNDQYLIVHQYADRDFFRILSLPDLKPLYFWGSKGRGPGEFTMPPVHFNTMGGESTVIISDLMGFRQEHYMLTDSTLILGKSYMLRYNGQPNLIEKPRHIDDSTYFADNDPIDASDTAEYIILRPDNDQLVQKFGNYPINDLEATRKMFLNMKSNAYNPEKDIFAAFYMSMNAFKLFRKDGELIGEYMVDGFRYEAVNPEEALNYTYRYIQDSSKDHIYTLGVYGNSTELYEPKADYGTESIFEVWDWGGNSLRRYEFDRFIHAFVVSEKHGRIYGYSYSDPTKVFEYELPAK